MTSKLRGAPRLEDALKAAIGFGLSIRYRGGDAIVRGPGWSIRCNVRKKDAPVDLVKRLRRLGWQC